MDVVIFSKFLIVLFVGSVTFWYVLTPYLIQPHPTIVKDVLVKTKLSGSAGASSDPENKIIQVENWTKWRLYVNATKQVIYGHTAANVNIEEGAVMNLEWRSEYTIEVSPSGVLTQSTPGKSCGYGIYRHIEARKDPDEVVRVVPRFLFGLPHQTVDEMYGTDVDLLPIVGVFTESPRYDRILIQAYMNVVVLSVLFLLWANNPPATIVAPKKTS